MKYIIRIYYMYFNAVFKMTLVLIVGILLYMYLIVVFPIIWLKPLQKIATKCGDLLEYVIYK